MRVRPLLILTGIVSSILGALVVYLILSVPNDLRADGLIKQARDDMKNGKDDKARQPEGFGPIHGGLWPDPRSAPGRRQTGPG